MMGLEVLAEKKKEGTVLANEGTASPAPLQDEGTTEQAASPDSSPEASTGSDPAAADPPR